MQTYTELGKYNELRVVRKVDFGYYLDAGEGFGEILLPNRYAPDDLEIGSSMNVFVYLDGESRPIATTEKAFGEVGQVVYLKVKSVTPLGAFLDWGVMKDLFLPFKEQNCTLAAGYGYFVYIYVDELTDRITATMKIDKYLDKLPHKMEEGQEVDAVIYKETDLGYKAVLGSTHTGMIYKNQVHQDIGIGKTVKAFIKLIREDGKIDLVLQKQGVERIFDSADQLYQAIQNSGGFLAVTDKSPSELISSKLGISKKTFKQALGKLYKERKVQIESDGIRLTTQPIDS